MNLFDQLVTNALESQPQLSSLRMVVEKELLHHDILRVLSENNLLTNLTFIGGTCLRYCYKGSRLSEDLDFTGGADFTRESLSTMGNLLVKNLNNKYGLVVKVNQPIIDKSNVDTWKIKIETRPEQKHLPAQRINIDICAVPSYEKRLTVISNPYGVDMGTSGLVLQAQSREEIYVDKLLALAFRRNRIKHRDLWDIMWLHGRGVEPKFELIPLKLQDRNLTIQHFLNLFDERTKLLQVNHEMILEFIQEMKRFLPPDQINKIIEQDNLWGAIINLIKDLGEHMYKNINST